MGGRCSCQPRSSEVNLNCDYASVYAAWHARPQHANCIGMCVHFVPVTSTPSIWHPVLATKPIHIAGTVTNTTFDDNFAFAFGGGVFLIRGDTVQSLMNPTSAHGKWSICCVWMSSVWFFHHLHSSWRPVCTSSCLLCVFTWVCKSLQLGHFVCRPDHFTAATLQW